MPAFIAQRDAALKEQERAANAESWMPLKVFCLVVFFVGLGALLWSATR